MQETRVWSLGWEDPLEEGMATHSSILAWRIPRTEEPGGLQSTGSPRVRHSRAHTHTHTQTHVWLWRAVFLVSAPRAPGFPHRAHGKESVCNAGEPASIPGWGRSPGEGNGNPLQYSCLEIPLGRERSLVGYSPWGRKSWTWLND